MRQRRRIQEQVSYFSDTTFHYAKLMEHPLAVPAEAFGSGYVFHLACFLLATLSNQSTE
jgi:hypothetical protein